MTITPTNGGVILTEDDAEAFNRQIGEDPSPAAMESLQRGLEMAREFERRRKVTVKVTQPMRVAADMARSAALREDENDQIGALNAALDAAFAAQPADCETLAQEFARLVKEYNEGDDRTKPEAWNLLADYAVENAPSITNALERAEKAEAERDEARQIVRDIHWMARRYASGRHTYAPSMFNEAISKAVSGGWLTADNVSEPLLADDPIDGPAPTTAARPD